MLNITEKNTKVSEDKNVIDTPAVRFDFDAPHASETGMSRQLQVGVRGCNSSSMSIAFTFAYLKELSRSNDNFDFDFNSTNMVLVNQHVANISLKEMDIVIDKLVALRDQALIAKEAFAVKEAHDKEYRENVAICGLRSPSITTTI